MTRALVDQQDDANRRTRHEIGQLQQSVWRDRFLAIGATIRVSPGDRLEQRIGPRLTLRDGNVRGKDGLRTGRKLEPSLRRPHVGSEPEESRRTHEVLDRTAQSEMHFPAERVEGPQVACAIGVDINGVERHIEQPRLRIVRAGGKSGCAQRLEASVPISIAPLVPWSVRRTGCSGEHASFPRSISKCRKRNGCAASEECLLALHESLLAQWQPRLALSSPVPGCFFTVTPSDAAWQARRYPHPVNSGARQLMT